MQYEFIIIRMHATFFPPFLPCRHAQIVEIWDTRIAAGVSPNSSSNSAATSPTVSSNQLSTCTIMDMECHQDKIVVACDNKVGKLDR